MARPQGHNLNTRAWDDILRLTGTSLTLISERSEIPRPTLSGLVGGFHRASVPMAFKIAAAMGVHPETLFPSLSTVAGAEKPAVA